MKTLKIIKIFGLTLANARCLKIKYKTIEVAVGKIGVNIKNFIKI